MGYVFMTDSDSDLPYRIKAEYNIPVVYMPYAIDGKEYFDDLGQTIDHKAFFDKMRNGAAPVTSALNEAAYLEYFEPILKENDLLFLAFSSQMSCTIQAVYAVQKQLLEKYPERKFIVVDTMNISAPMLVLVLKALEMYKAGKPMEEVAEWVENNKKRAQAWITVDDLKYLSRGGRLSTTAAVMGSLLNLKPIITGCKDGKLNSFDKVRGRKKAINYLAEHAFENIIDPTEAPIIIIHADALADAESLKAMVAAKYPEADIMLENVGPVIGAHCGPGTLAISFLGKEMIY